MCKPFVQFPAGLKTAVGIEVVTVTIAFLFDLDDVVGVVVIFKCRAVIFVKIIEVVDRGCISHGSFLYCNPVKL